MLALAVRQLKLTVVTKVVCLTRKRSFFDVILGFSPLKKDNLELTWNSKPNVYLN